MKFWKMTRSILLVILLAIGSVGVVSLTGCKEKGPAEEAGEAIDDAAKDAADKAEDAADDVKDALE